MRKVNPEDLRASILQAAIQGKLVPQDPNDEPASVLLDRIREEKHRLIKEGKIKKPKHESFIFRRDNHYYENIDGKEVCIDDEIPFEIPQSWSWTRLGSLVTKLGSGATPRGGKQVYKESGISFIRSQNVYNDGLRLDSVAFIDEETNNLHKGSIVRPRDLLLNITGGSIGRCALVPDVFDMANVNQHVMIIRLIDHDIRQYVHLVICSPFFFSKVMDLQVGATKEGLSADSASKMLLPLAPLSEQYRIVRTVSNHFKLLDELSSLYEKAVCIDTRLKNDLESAIIQYAIQGKLVSQNPDETPVHINCKYPIIRRDNSYYEIKDGEEDCIDEIIPFNIPSSWIWLRLSDACTYIKRGKSPKYSEKNEYPVIAQKCNQWSGLDMSRCLFINPNTIDSYSEDRFVCENDILVNSTGLGTLGRVGIVHSTDLKLPTVVDSHVTIIRCESFIMPRFLYWYLRGPYIQSIIEDISTGSTKQKELTTSVIGNMIVPVPPKQEQARILEKIDILLEIVNNLDDI